MLDLIIPVGVSGYEQNFPDFAPGFNAGLFVNEDHQIHGLGDQDLLRRAGCLSDEAFEPDQSTEGVVGVDCCRTAGIPCVPCFQQRVCLRTEHFTHHDARGFQPHAGTQAGQHRYVTDCPEIEIVLHRALQLGRIFDRNHPIMWVELG